LFNDAGDPAKVDAGFGFSHLFDAFSSREPVSTSLENALAFLA
jgi:hypothetical protein